MRQASLSLYALLFVSLLAFEPPVAIGQTYYSLGQIATPTQMSTCPTALGFNVANGTNGTTGAVCYSTTVTNCSNGGDLIDDWPSFTEFPPLWVPLNSGQL